jgi:hypothetical protein
MMMRKNKLLIVIISIIMISCTGGGYPYIGKKYKLFSDSSHDIGILDSKNTIVVSGLILKYAFDSVYIIAEQKPRDIILKDVYLHIMDKTAILDYPTTEAIFNKSLIRQYWIINKVIDSVYGPYQKAEFLYKRKELKVPESLKMKFISNKLEDSPEKYH